MNPTYAPQNTKPAGAPFKKPFIAKGHDRQLGDAQDRRDEVIVLTVGGESHTGVIVKRDKFTISLDCGQGDKIKLLYKHAIESIDLPKKGI